MTGSEPSRGEQEFETVRHETLRQWYTLAHDTDSVVRKKAAARLELQLLFRNNRAQREAYVANREKCKASGDKVGFAAAQKRLKGIGYGLGFCHRMRQGIPDCDVDTLSRKWFNKADTIILEALLADSQYDMPADFGLTKEVFTALTDASDAASKRQNDIKSEAPLPDGSDSCYHGLEEAADASLIKEQASVWDSHEAFMKLRFGMTNMADPLQRIRLATQKKIFEAQTYDEMYTARTRQQFQQALPQNMLFRLSSTKLWRHYRNGRSWQTPHWTPGGYLQLRTAAGITTITFDFGERSFTIDVVLAASFDPVKCTVACLETGTRTEIELIFIANDCVKVLFPALPIMEPDTSCDLQAMTDVVVEFAGVRLE